VWFLNNNEVEIVNSVVCGALVIRYTVFITCFFFGTVYCFIISIIANICLDSQNRGEENGEGKGNEGGETGGDKKNNRTIGNFI
jgi:hypothetical protein